MKNKIAVEVIELDPKTLFLSQHLGNGSMADKKFNASFTLPNHSLIVDVDEKKYEVKSTDLIEAIVNFHIGQEEKKPNFIKKKEDK